MVKAGNGVRKRRKARERQKEKNECVGGESLWHSVLHFSFSTVTSSTTVSVADEEDMQSQVREQLEL